MLSNTMDIMAAHIALIKVCISSPSHLYLPSEPHNLRFQSDINHWAHEAFILGKTVFGVKGLSLLYRFLSIHHIPVDYMLAILEGVVKVFSCTWLNPTYSDLRCYLGKVAKDIDNH